MRKFLRYLPLCLSLVALSTTLAEEKAAAKADADGWVTIFDGKSTDGWKINENKESWKLDDGALVAKGNRSHVFYVGDEKPFKNFVLELEVQTLKNSNGGVYFHTKYQDEGWPAQGHECQVNNSYNADPQKTASVYRVKPNLKAPAEDDKWFKYTVTVKGAHVEIKIDDKVITEYDEDAAALDKDTKIEKQRRIGSGTFALQAHDPGSTVKYRNIKVKRLAD